MDFDEIESTEDTDDIASKFGTCLIVVSGVASNSFGAVVIIASVLVCVSVSVVAVVDVAVAVARDIDVVVATGVVSATGVVAISVAGVVAATGAVTASRAVAFFVTGVVTATGAVSATGAVAISVAGVVVVSVPGIVVASAGVVFVFPSLKDAMIALVLFKEVDIFECVRRGEIASRNEFAFFGTLCCSGDGSSEPRSIRSVDSLEIVSSVWVGSGLGRGTSSGINACEFFLDSADRRNPVEVALFLEDFPEIRILSGDDDSELGFSEVNTLFEIFIPALDNFLVISSPASWSLSSSEESSAISSSFSLITPPVASFFTNR